jgi:pimeloyl-ACP methyl ester carboxylesterase
MSANAVYCEVMSVAAQAEETSSEGSQPPQALLQLVARYNAEAFELARPQARVRLAGAGPEPFDVVLHSNDRPQLVPAGRGRPDALLEATPATWRLIVEDVRGGMTAFRRGQLRVRYDLHLGVGFLAATAPGGDGALHFRQVATAEGAISVCEAGEGPPVLLLHGLGATKVSFLPTLAALAPDFHAIAVDLPGFGDSDKPIRAGYHPPYFARTMIALIDALGLDRVDVIGNSMGGRVALELGLRYPGRVKRLALLAPSMAWRRSRPWALPLKLVMPQLGLIQPAPRQVVEAIVRRVVPGSDDEWTAAGIDEFLRSYLTPRGRSAFYTAARNIYLEEPFGPRGFWTRLPTLQADSLFVWGEKDTLVPARFGRYVQEALPASTHLELSCGHVPQLEAPEETHEAIRRFLNAARG